ncbi:MAG: hypothetical protein O3A00_06210, partial [Planctomycetota bacterium]|nr:hypothetical protein [Planctomycetota bacterium]
MRKRVLMMLILVFVLSCGLYYARLLGSLDRAKAYLRQGQPAAAQDELRTYMWLRPEDAAGYLLMAESLLYDKEREPQDAARLAVDFLDMIPEQSSRAPESLMRQARLYFLILHKPAAAEACLERSLSIDGKSFDANYLMWKLLDMTERGDLSEPYFWKSLELDKPEQRAFRLREWYLSQFHPASANELFDRRMGFLNEDEEPNNESEFKRLFAFHSNETEAVMTHAALAKWFHRKGNLNESRRVVEGAIRLPNAAANPFLAQAAVAIYFELGEFDDVHLWLDRLTAESHAYAYWAWKGRVADEIDNDLEAAVAAYKKAAPIWPGNIDWEGMHRQVRCLQRLDRTDGLDQLRARTKQVQQLTNATDHEVLRELLSDLRSSKTHQAMAKFYTSLGRDREAELWLSLSLAGLP